MNKKPGSPSSRALVIGTNINIKVRKHPPKSLLLRFNNGITIVCGNIKSNPEWYESNFFVYSSI